MIIVVCSLPIKKSFCESQKIKKKKLLFLGNTCLERMLSILSLWRFQQLQKYRTGQKLHSTDVRDLGISKIHKLKWPQVIKVFSQIGKKNLSRVIHYITRFIYFNNRHVASLFPRLKSFSFDSARTLLHIFIQFCTRLN